MLVPAQFGAQEGWILDLMLKARDEYNVRLKLMDIQTRGGDCAYSHPCAFLCSRLRGIRD